jgi:hypothetical protein
VAFTFSLGLRAPSTHDLVWYSEHRSGQPFFIISGSKAVFSNMLISAGGGGVIPAALFGVDGSSVTQLQTVRWGSSLRAPVVQCNGDNSNVITTRDSSTIAAGDVLCRPGCGLQWDQTTLCKA